VSFLGHCVLCEPFEVWKLACMMSPVVRIVVLKLFLVPSVLCKLKSEQYCACILIDHFEF
jgi:hypothetical protein